jgi:hypothetical protein
MIRPARACCHNAWPYLDVEAQRRWPVAKRVQLLGLAMDQGLHT